MSRGCFVYKGVTVPSSELTRYLTASDGAGSVSDLLKSNVIIVRD